MRNYEEGLRYIYSLIKFGVKLGLENTRTLLRLAGNPHESYKCIHVAGTNGKGSTSRALQGILMALAFRTGLFTSPHMVRFTERIRINEEEISPEDVASLTEQLREVISTVPDLRPTYFEFVTALALRYFQEKAVDWAVVETGMGGRFDATNVITPEVSVITTVGLDHRQFLGETIEEIAYEKAGIIKDRRPAVVGPVPEEAGRVILRVAEERHSPVKLYGRDFFVRVKNQTPEGTGFDFYSTSLPGPIEDLWVPLVGTHLAVNASLAAEAALLLFGPQEETLRAIRTGLRKASLEGRFERVEFSGRRFVLDGAHNGQAIEALIKTLRVFDKNTRPLVVFGAMADKDTDEMLLPLLEVSRRVILTRPAYERAMEPEELLKMAAGLLPEAGARVQLSRNVPEAIEMAIRASSEGEIILVTGSFYVVGEAKEFMGQRPILKELREGF